MPEQNQVAATIQIVFMIIAELIVRDSVSAKISRKNLNILMICLLWGYAKWMMVFVCSILYAIWFLYFANAK